MMRARAIIWTALITVACTGEEAGVIGAGEVGTPCARVSDCQPGLSCSSGACTAPAPPSTRGRAGTPCNIDATCSAALCCGNQGVCRPRLSSFAASRCGAAPGEACGLGADCHVGLVCDGTGQCAEPNGPNQSAKGAACKEPSDCIRPLICGADNTCQPLPFFPGVDCTRSDEELGAFRLLFEVPRAKTVDEFYRLPFPNDIRKNDAGQIDMSGHPSPGQVAGIDFDELYLRALEEDMDGFGLSQPIFLRFSDRVNRTTLSSTAAKPSVYLVNLENDEKVATQLAYNWDKGQFVCSNALAVAPLDGRPLSPKTTYAAVVRRTVVSMRGETPLPDADFTLLLSDAEPAESALKKAHARYAPLRAHLARKGIATDDIAGAAVFTTTDPAAIGPKIRAAVHSAPAPEVKSSETCSGMPTACSESAPERACSGNAAFVEIHGKLTSPTLQKGARPYIGPTGAFVLDSRGRPRVQGSEDICFALAVPNGAAPVGGWPVVIYAHGTGGNFTSGIKSVAAELASIQVATLGFDGVMHGPRQGLPAAARVDPGRLFFNATNPRASRDNVLQGSADLFNIVRLLSAPGFKLSAAGVAVPITVDADRIMFYGHSQGTVVAPAFLANESSLRASVLSGAGAEIGLTLISKQKPNDIAGLIRTIFGDQSVTRLHPMIGLMSWFFGAADAVPYAGAFAGQVDLLHVYGLDDSFTPEVTQQALVHAGGYPIVGPVLRTINGVSGRTAPLSGNLGGRTAGAVQFDPMCTANDPGCDGHFVGTNVPAAKNTIRGFLQSAATTNAPAVIQR